MERDPFAAVEHEGDVISDADMSAGESFDVDVTKAYAPTEYDLGVAYETSRAARQIVEEPAQPSEASMAYDAAAEEVDRRADQGLDTTAAWERADETGEARHAQQQEDQKRQEEANRRGNSYAQQTLHEARLAHIQALPEHERTEEERRYLALNRAREARRGRRA